MAGDQDDSETRVLVKKSIGLSRLNFPTHLHRGSGSVSAQTPYLMRAPMIFVVGLWTFLRALFLEPATVALENLALRHQRLVLQRCVRRPGLAQRD